MESRYSLKGLIDQVGQDDFALLLRMILDRVPIIIIGTDMMDVDALVSELLSLAPHRDNYVFRTDFTLQEEYVQLCQEESENIDIPRAIFSSPATDSMHIFQTIDSFKGWIAGFKPSDGIAKTEILSQVSHITETYLLIDQNEGMRLSLNGLRKNGLDLQFEKNLIERAIKKTDEAVTRMLRVLQKKVKSATPESIMGSIMNFDNEACQISDQIFEQEIKDFAQAGRRAVAILTRLDLLREINHAIEISGKTLLQCIDYIDVNPDRLLKLVQAEYGMDFSECIKGGRSAHIGDRVDGFWG